MIKLAKPVFPNALPNHRGNPGNNFINTGHNANRTKIKNTNEPSLFRNNSYNGKLHANPYHPIHIEFLKNFE